MSENPSEAGGYVALLAPDTATEPPEQPSVPSAGAGRAQTVADASAQQSSHDAANDANHPHHIDLQPDAGLAQQSHQFPADARRSENNGGLGPESLTQAQAEADGISNHAAGLATGATQEQPPSVLAPASEQMQGAADMPPKHGPPQGANPIEPTTAATDDFTPQGPVTGLSDAHTTLAASQPGPASSQPDLAIQNWPQTSLADHGLMQQQLQQQLQMQMLGAPQFSFIPGGDYLAPTAHAQGSGPFPDQQYMAGLSDVTADGVVNQAGYTIAASDGVGAAAANGQAYGYLPVMGAGPSAGATQASYAASLGLDPALFTSQAPADAAAPADPGTHSGAVQGAPRHALHGTMISAGMQPSAEMSFAWGGPLQQPQQQQTGEMLGGMGVKDPRLLLQEAIQDAHPVTSGLGLGSAGGSPRNPLKRPAPEANLSSDSKRTSSRRQKVTKDAASRQQQQQQPQPQPQPIDAMTASGDAPGNQNTSGSQPAASHGGASEYANQRDQLSFLAAIAAQYPSPTVSSALGVSRGPEAVALAHIVPSGAEGPTPAAPGQDSMVPASFVPQQLHSMQPMAYQAMVPAGATGVQGAQYLPQAGMLPAHQLSLVQSLQGYPNLDAHALQLMQQLPESSGSLTQQDLQQQQQQLLQQLGQFPGGVQPLQPDGFPLQQPHQEQKPAAEGAPAEGSGAPAQAPDGGPASVAPLAGDAAAAAAPAAAAADAAPADGDELPVRGKKSTKKSRQGRSSIYKGVLKGRGPDRWEAQIRAWGKAVHLGTYPDQDEAARAYDKATICLGRPDDMLNFKLEDYTSEMDKLQTTNFDRLSKELVSNARAMRKSSMSCTYKGVTKRAQMRWQAQIQDAKAGSKNISLGHYASPEAAGRAYDMAAICLRGEKAMLNFSVDDYTDQSEELQATPFLELVSTLAANAVAHSREVRLTSRFKGVWLDKARQLWRTQLADRDLNVGPIYVGQYANEEDAAKAYDRAAIAFRGKANANTNYPIEYYADELQWLETTSFNQVVAAIRARARGGQCIGSFPPVADDQQPPADGAAAKQQTGSQATGASPAGTSQGGLPEQASQQQLLEQQQHQQPQPAAVMMT